MGSPSGLRLVGSLAGVSNYHYQYTFILCHAYHVACKQNTCIPHHPTIIINTADPDIIKPGILEMEHAARLLLSEGYEPDIIYTSRLTRAVKSTWALLNELNAPYLPVYKSWRLNERNYGALTGLKKMDAAKAMGVEVVQAWRNSLKARPPPMKKDDVYYPGNDRRYDDLGEDQIPLTESLMDCMERARPIWEYGIAKELEKGNTVLVVAHTNILRGLIKVVDGECISVDRFIGRYFAAQLLTTFLPSLRH